MPDTPPPLLSEVREDDTLVVTLRGAWDIRKDPPGFAQLAPRFHNGSPAARVTFDTSELEHYDSSLISLLLQLHKQCEAHEASFDLAALPNEITQLLDMALAVPETRDARSAGSHPGVFRSIGLASLEVVNEMRELLTFLGECLLSLGRLVTGRAHFRRKDFWITLQECGLEALPIVALIGLLIGMIFAFVGAYQMAGIGATIFVANLVAIAMVREMGCLMTGVIMSGRTGAAFAAQLGSMKVNEEIDALKTFGFSPIDFLVLPRILALIAMMPLLTVYSIVVGIAGGALVTCLGFGVGLGAYLNQTIEALTFKSLALGLAKSVVFGVIIAGAGCLKGMQCESSASGVGTATTAAVVVSITAIIFSDCVFAVITTVLDI